MYCSHFGLHRPPFNNTPDPTFYYSTSEHEEALATLQYAVFQRKGFVLVTGEVGAGKTLIGRMFLRQVDRDAAVAVITHTNLTGRQLLAAICAEFELEVPPDATNLQLTERLQNFLLDQFARDRFAVVVLDEAQNLPNESFEELRMLGNLEADDAKLLQVCILGQPELRDRFRDPSLKQMDQRLFRKFHLPSLNREHAERYLCHRLSVAGCRRNDLFTPEAIDRIFRLSAGTPRLINQICDNALLTAYAAHANQVTADMIEETIEQDWSILGSERETQADASITIAPQATQPISGPTVSETVSCAASVDIIPPADEEVPLAPETRAAIDSSKAAIELTQQQSEQIARAQEAVRQMAEQTLQTQEKLQALTSQAHEEWKISKASSDHVAQTMETSQKQARQIGQTRAAVRAMTRQTSERQAELKKLLEKANDRWQTVQDKLDVYRRDVQQKIGQAVQQYHTIQEQFETLRQSSTSSEQVEGLRQEYLKKTEELLQQIARQRTEYKDRLAELSDQWARMREQMSHMADDNQVRSLIQSLETTFEQRIGQAVTQLGRQRGDITGLTEVFEKHCSETVRQLEAIKEAQVATETRFAETRARLESRLNAQSERLESLDGRLSEKITATQRTLGELSTQTATTSALYQVRQEHAELIEQALGQVRSQSQELALLKEELADQGKKSNQEQIGQLADVQSQVASQEEHLQRLRHKLLDYLTSTEKRFAEFGERFAERKDLQELKAVCLAGVEELRGQVDTAVEQVRQSQAAVSDQLRSEQKALANEWSQRQTADVSNLRHEQVQAAATLRSEQRQLADHLTQRHETDVQTLRQEQEKTADVLRGEQRETADTLRTEREEVVGELRHEHQQTADEIRSEQKQVAEQILDRHNVDVQTLRQEQVETAETLRTEQREVANQLTGRYTRGLTELERKQQATADALRTESQELVGQLDTKHSTALTQLRNDQQVSLEEVRRSQEAQAAEILERIEQNRTAVNKVMGRVIHRFRSTQEQLENLESSSSADRDQLLALKSRQEEEAQALLQELDSQKSAMEQQFVAIAGRLQHAQNEISALQATSAQASEVDELQQRQASDREKILVMLGAQRRDLETLFETVNDRSRELTERLDALPADIATVRQIDDIRNENANQIRTVLGELETRKANLEDGIQKVADYCDQTHAAVTELARKAASAHDVQALREKQDRQLRTIEQRIDRQDVVHGSKVHVLAKKLKDSETRVRQLEEMERPKPVQIELTPQVGRQLGDVVEAARQEHEQLSEAVGRAGNIATHLHGASERVQQTLQEWASNADEVEAQSRRLRASATMAADILKAMEKCHAALDKKLNSQRWQTELARGEALAERLEKATTRAQSTTETLQAALNDFERCHSQVEEWTAASRQAQQTAQQLRKLMLEASQTSGQISRRLEQRQRMLNAVAKKTNNLMSLIDAARRIDEGEPATPQPKRATGAEPRRPVQKPQRVGSVDWPSFRMQPAQVG